MGFLVNSSCVIAVERSDLNSSVRMMSDGIELSFSFSLNEYIFSISFWTSSENRFIHVRIVFLQGRMCLITSCKVSFDSEIEE
jgi:hypothetical protein